MAGSAQVHQLSFFRVGDFEVDAQSGELRKGGAAVEIQDLPLKALVLLAKSAPRIVTRDELRQELWSQDVFVDFQHSINSTIKRLRQSLGDSADSPKYIETVGRRGYRLIAPVEIVAGRDPDRSLPFIVPADRELGDSSPRRNQRLLGWGSSLLLLVLLAAGWLWLHLRKNGGAAADARDRTTISGGELISKPILAPLMGLGGEQRMPSLSPDGSRIAFLLQTPTPNKSGIYAMVAGSQSLLQLSTNTNDSDPTWSPDGRFIAFLRNTGETFSILLVPTLGGQERKVYSGLRTPWEGPVSLSFSPDGQRLAFAEWSSETQQSSIKVLSFADSQVRSLTSPPQGYHDSAPAFSPHGMSLAFVRWTGPIFVDDIFVMPAAGGEPEQITFDRQRIFSAPAWTPDEKEILFSSTRAGMKSLWRIAGAGGNAKPIAGSGPGADHPSVSGNGELAYEYGVEDENLWRVELRDRTQIAGPAQPLLSSKTSNLMPDFSPDGKRIAFESDRSGYEEIWTCDADGSNPTQVTKLERYSGSPRWSPDGRYIAFDYRSEQHTEIYVVEVGSGSPQPLARFANADNVVPSWSRDGRWVYFASNRGGKVFHIWKVPLNDGSSVQVTKHSGFGIAESPDGIFYTRLSEPGIMKLASPDSPETFFWRGPGPDNWANWVLSDDGIYFIDSRADVVPEIKFIDFKTRKATSIARLDKPSFYGLTIAPDRKTLVYSQHDRTEHDIVFMRNFY